MLMLMVVFLCRVRYFYIPSNECFVTRFVRTGYHKVIIALFERLTVDCGGYHNLVVMDSNIAFTFDTLLTGSDKFAFEPRLLECNRIAGSKLRSSLLMCVSVESGVDIYLVRAQSLVVGKFYLEVYALVAWLNRITVLWFDEFDSGFLGVFLVHFTRNH